MRQLPNVRAELEWAHVCQDAYCVHGMILCPHTNTQTHRLQQSGEAFTIHEARQHGEQQEYTDLHKGQTIPDKAKQALKQAQHVGLQHFIVCRLGKVDKRGCRVTLGVVGKEKAEHTIGQSVTYSITLHSATADCLTCTRGEGDCMAASMAGTSVAC